MFESFVKFVRETYSRPEGMVPLHEPVFRGREKEYLNDCIDSTYVSSVGKYVDLFEEKIAEYTGAKYAVATTNGTCALHLALTAAGVRRDELVITQPLSFISASNAICYTGASPLYVDIDPGTLGLSDEKLSDFLADKTTVRDDGKCYHNESGKRIAACIPMHTFGHPVIIDAVTELCGDHGIPVVEDAAEAIGSKFKAKHAGTFGLLGIYSFNGNKTITCGGGGMVVTDNKELGALCKHLSTQAKVPHRWNFEHDHVGYNYRLPNINAALACAQMEQLDGFLENKRKLASLYKSFFSETGLEFFSEPENCRSNYWLNAVIMKDRRERDEFLQFTFDRDIMTRPAWTLMPQLKMYANCITENIDNAHFMTDRLVNIPSSITQ